MDPEIPGNQWTSNSQWQGPPSKDDMNLLHARLTGEIYPNPSSLINATLFNDPINFPLNQSIYVDATQNMRYLLNCGGFESYKFGCNRFGAQMATQILTCQLQPNSTQQRYTRANVTLVLVGSLKPGKFEDLMKGQNEISQYALEDLVLKVKVKGTNSNGKLVYDDLIGLLGE
ncbi:uncharacterized protein MELLADRAFT_107970 [Melampsora larici-populina 98AG31]|uniref:Uncharacterized protein n=1 Tax=Melampsora larici-populina (strain 98AG31 / pathotype 3-4-7) TaxID=747676 RepID=F4RRJ7_MELLP|nr:uncharacterized protein MELLADRAFT_107970 [Melampsora larici-populina 98AG31]EGG04943.1 hypothetical protein MELLADRAFT_107970 [Melampsora larici-populina 98AG31]